MINNDFSFDWAKSEMANPTSDTGKAIAAYVETVNYPHKVQLFRYLYDAVSAKDADPIETPDALPSDLPYDAGQNIVSISNTIQKRHLSLSTIQFLCKHVGMGSAIMVSVTTTAMRGNNFICALFPNLRIIEINPLDPINLHAYSFPCVRRTIYRGETTGMTKAAAVECLKKISDDNITNIFTIRAFMNDDIASAISEVFGARQVFYASTYRTSVFADFSDGNGAATKVPFPDVSDLTWNMAQQYTWCRLMQPKYAYLKMRFPFYNEEEEKLDILVANDKFRAAFDRANTEINGLGAIDYVTLARNRQVKFFDGDLYLRPWARPGSSETSLFTPCTEIKDYGSYTAYENKMFLYNKVYRGFLHCKNNFVDSRLGFDCCNECALECKILAEWVSAYEAASPMLPASTPRTVNDLVKSLVEQSTGEPLLSYFHGNFLDPRDAKKFTDLIRIYHLMKDSDKEKARFDKTYSRSKVLPISVHGGDEPENGDSRDQDYF